MKKIPIIFFFIISCSIFSQVKVGDNPDIIDSNSVLELESSDKVLVITRVSASEMTSIQPLKGGLVYNTDTDCVYTYDGSAWKSLCHDSERPINSESIKVTTAPSAPSNNTIGDFWQNTTTNSMSIWDGNQWIPIDTNPSRGNGSPTAVTAPSPLAGDIYVDTTTGDIYSYDGTTWINTNTTVNANNGVVFSSNNTLQLGGVLIRPTIITTDATNTLAIEGLQDGDTTQDDIITVNRTTGVLRKINSSSFFREEVTNIVAIDGQLRFTPNININDTKKVNVYRNGVRIDFTVIDATTIEIEPEAICYQGDEIRIVQFY